MVAEIFVLFYFTLFQNARSAPDWPIRESLFALKIFWTNYALNPIPLLRRLFNVFAYSNKASYRTIFLKQNKKPTIRLSLY